MAKCSVVKKYWYPFNFFILLHDRAKQFCVFYCKVTDCARKKLIREAARRSCNNLQLRCKNLQKIETL